MNTRFSKNILFSINTKLFLWFWLITLVSIAATRFVGQQLSTEEILRKPIKDHIKKLEHVSRVIRRNRPDDIQQFLMKSPSRIGKTLLIEDVEKAEVYVRHQERFSPFVEYIKKNTLTNMATIRLPFGQLTGPLIFETKNKQLKLYYFDRRPPQNLSSVIKQLPPWLRFFIPLSISFVLCWLLARSLSKPIFRLQQAATQLGDGDLAIRVDKDATRKDELGDLAKSFNKMAEKLETSLGAQQRLIADVSHELRTPMTRLQLAIALAQKNTGQPAELNKYMQRCETEIERLDQMITNVLSLSRLENALYSVNIEPVELKSLLLLIIQDAQFIADEKSITIEHRYFESCSINGDVQLLTSAFSNVLINAVKYSPDKSRITVDMRTDDSTIVINVIDQGPGVPEEKIEKLFEPFYRIADARDRKTGGTGLGLAIAKQAIVAHSGKISAANNEQGLTVSIAIPRNI